MARVARTSRTSRASAIDPLTMDYDYLFKLLVIGDSAVGKSSLVKRFAQDQYDSSYISTIGVDFQIHTYRTPEDKVVKLQMWDTAGQERFRAITNSYYRGGHGIVLVYDCTDRVSLQNVAKVWLKEVRTYAREDVEVLLVGNKVDLAGHDNNVDGWDEEKEAQDLADQYGMTLIRTSAKSGENVSECFHGLANKLVRRRLREPRKGEEPTFEGETVDLGSKATDWLRGCCA